MEKTGDPMDFESASFSKKAPMSGSFMDFFPDSLLIGNNKKIEIIISLIAIEQSVRLSESN